MTDERQRDERPEHGHEHQHQHQRPHQHDHDCDHDHENGHHDREHHGEPCHHCRCHLDAALIDLVCDVVRRAGDCRCPCHRRPAEEGEPLPSGGEGGGRVPWRPGRHPGSSTGDLGGQPITPADVHSTPKPTVWPGPRKDMWLPLLFFRANPGDTGTRPVVGPFWESPDVYILPGVAPDLAPPVPPQLGQTALAGRDNTVYAHVWNLGRGKAREVVVEFYWCNPALGFNPLSAHRIGTAVTWLGERGSGECHKVVKCPTSWVATYLNGGHECLLVRAWDVAADPLTTPDWDASINRHLGQRNIHVVAGGAGTDPVTFSVGPLFGHAADIAVTRHAPATMPWLQLHSGQRGQFPGQAVGTGALTLGTPGQFGAGTTMRAHGDDTQVVFATGDQPPPAGQGHVYRVTAAQQGQLIGGYTVVMLG